MCCDSHSGPRYGINHWGASDPPGILNPLGACSCSLESIERTQVATYKNDNDVDSRKEGRTPPVLCGLAVHFSPPNPLLLLDSISA